MITPLALVAQRRQHLAAKAFRDRFEDALVLGEASVKWACVAAISILKVTDPAFAHRLEYDMVRADGLGAWVRALQIASQRLHRERGLLAKALGRHYSLKLRRDEHGTQLWEARDGLQSVIAALDAADFQESGTTRKSRLDLMMDFVFLRNRTRGHGAKRPAFYETHTPVLETAVTLLAQVLAVDHLSLCSFVGYDPPNGSVLLVLEGSAPRNHVALPLPDTSLDRNSLFWSWQDAGGSDCLCSSRLALYDADRNAFFLANGTWKEASLKGEFLDYATGETRHIHSPQYGGPKPQAPKSHTSAAALQFAAGSIHTVPPQDPTYVSRPALQNTLTTLLTDRTHRIITIKGPGGTGKTSLAIHVLHTLTDAVGCPFSYVVWLSARDVDLLPDGPAVRRRDVTDIDSIADAFCRALEIHDTDSSPRGVFVDHVSAATRTNATLIVIDNFETLNDPEGVHRFLDEHIVMPSKLLITSRHKTYKGDFPIDVWGMEHAEASILLQQEARSHLCEPRLTPQVAQKIIEVTDARPYPMKLLVAQFAHGERDLNLALRTLLNRHEILDALFDRSYAMLGDGGQYLYLLVGALSPCPEVVAQGLMAQHNLDYFQAVEEATRCSLLQRGGPEGGPALLEMPTDARAHARREIVGHADEMSIRADIREVRGALGGSGRDVVERFFRGAVAQLFQDASATPRLLDLCERCAGTASERWLELADAFAAKGDTDTTRRMFQEAARCAPMSASIWRRWADWEDQHGDRMQRIYKGIRAIELGEDDIYFCSTVAGQLLYALQQPEMKDLFPPHRREGLVGALRFQLERHRSAGILNADGLAKLGWLYLAEYGAGADPALVSKAMAAAEEGLTMSKEHKHCQSLYEKCEATMASPGYQRQLADKQSITGGVRGPR